MNKLADGWTRCRPQEISKLAGRVRARRQRRVAVSTGLLVACAAIVLTIWLYPRPDQGPDFAGISCERVMDLSDVYVKKQLAPDLQDQVQRHIALCPNCRPMFENMPPVSDLKLPAYRHFTERTAHEFRRRDSALNLATIDDAASDGL